MEEKLYIDSSINLDNIAEELVAITVNKKIKELKLRGEINLQIRNISHRDDVYEYGVSVTNKSKTFRKTFRLIISAQQVIAYSLNKLTSLTDQNSASVGSLGWGNSMG